MKKHVKHWALLAALFLVLATVVVVYAQPTGIGRTNILYVERLDVRDTSSVYPSLIVQQSGTGDAIQVQNSSMTEVWAVDSTGSMDTVTMTVGGGYGGSGIDFNQDGSIYADGAVQFDSTMAVTGNVTIGGGYGSTGATISTAGVGQFNGALTTDGALTADSGAFGGGYGSSGCSVTAAGALYCDAGVQFDSTGAITGPLTIGGGYGSTGMTLGSDGTAYFDGAAQFDSTVAMTGNVTIGGGYGATGCTISSAGVVQCNGAATFDGNITIDGQGGSELVIDSDGDTVLGNNSGMDDIAQLRLGDSPTGTFSVLTGNFLVGNGTPSTAQDGEDAYVEGGFEVDGIARFDGAIDANSTVDVAGASTLDLTYLKIDQIAKTASYNVTAGERSSLFTNIGATGEVTFTLPAAAEGYNYCFYVFAAYTVTIELDGADQIHHLTNAAGDRLQNTGTAGDSVCLVAADATYWIPLQEIGTWSDVN